MSPELRHLRYFVAVAEELSYARAAERLHVVQQTLSSSIQQLEQELGVQLLVRTTRSVALTPAGEALLDHGRRTLEAAEGSWEAARRSGREAMAELRVAYTATLGPTAIPAIHDAMAARAREIIVTWSERWSREVVESVAVGVEDAGLARHAERLRHLECRTVAQEPQGVLVSASHPLAQRSTVPITALEHEELLMFPRELAPGYYDALVESCRAAGFEPTTRLTPDTGSSGVKVPLMERGEVVAIAPLGAGRAYVRRSRGGIAFVPLAEPAPALPIDLVWNPLGASATLEIFIEVLTELGREGRLVPTQATAN